jgi:hypothetical protein
MDEESLKSLTEEKLNALYGEWDKARLETLKK